jgi:hypothetical protein
MNSNSNLRDRAPSERPATIVLVVLTPKEAAQRSRLSSPRHPRRRFAALFLSEARIAREAKQRVEFDRGLFLARRRDRFRICCFGARLIGSRGRRAGFLRNH